MTCRSAYFDYMGYHNTMGYPLDFWKVKLRDNWIRNNFYRLELWKEDSQMVPLLIERGPYVGLVDITDELSVQTLSKPKLRPEALKKLNQIVNFDGSIILAGGAVFTFLYDYPHYPADLDFFITTKDPQIGENKIKELIDNHVHISYKFHIRDIEYLNKRGRKIKIPQETIDRADLDDPRLYFNYSYPAGVIRTQNAITIGSGACKFQVVLRLYNCPSEVVHGFDLDSSGLLFDGERVWVTHRAYHALKNKINYFDFDRMSPSYGYRLAKYAVRGFDVWLPDFDSKKVRWSDLKHLSKVFNKRTKYEGEQLKYWSKAPFFLPEYYERYGLMDSNIITTIMERANPVDMILFARYFNFLPKLPISDYDESREKRQQYEPELITEENPRDIPKKKNPDWINPFDPETFGDKGFKRDNSRNSSPEWWEMAVPGYVKWTVLDSTPDHAIFNLNDRAAKISGLSKTIQWKTQNPMEQLTGTFNPSKLKDIDQWYNTAYFYGSKDRLVDNKGLQEEMLIFNK